MNRIVLWGVGERTKYYLKLEYFTDCTIVGFVTTIKQIDLFEGYPVFSIDELLCIQEEVDYIVISNEFYETIIQEIEKREIIIEKIVITDNIPLEPYRTYYKRLKNVSMELFQLLEKTPYILVKRNESDIVDSKMIIGAGKYERSIYMQDYVRYRTFELCSYEISRLGLNGAVAELGVFRGHFSSVINEHFPDKKLYLFDTFEGFDENEANDELKKGRCDRRFLEEHKDTSIMCMLNNIPNRDNVIVCKGFFPDSVTIDAKNEEYVFVSIDVDFEESMLSGLRFFYPRMVRGGMIFVHDYNTFFLDGIKEAIMKYEEEIGEKLLGIPIADRAGTYIIVKRD